MTDRPQLQILTACEAGQHQLQARHDVEKVGGTFRRRYVGDRCVVCGHWRPRPLSIGDQIELGLLSPEDFWKARSEGRPLWDGESS